MYLANATLDFTLGLVLLPVWVLAALAVRRLATRPDARRLRRGARIAAVLVVLALLLSAGRLYTFVQLATINWEFVQDRRAVTVLLLLLPGALATLVLSARRVFAAARRSGPDEPTELATPLVTFPPQLAAFGALGGFFEQFLPPHRSAWLNYAVYGLVLIAGGLLLAVRTRRRADRLTGRRAAPQRPRGRRVAVRLATTVVVVGVLATLVTTASQRSKFPDTFSMMKGTMDYGGGTTFAAGHEGHHAAGTSTGAEHASTHDHGPGKSAGAGTVSVDDLKGPEGTPDRRYTLTAREAKIKLASGRTVDAWTFNGQIPGPELRMKQGELVEITVVNRMKKTPVSVHWHGLDVPNGEDGVAGVTQDATRPGGTHTYRFRVKESGTFWYHSHQAASEQVHRGLFGPLVIDPAEPPARPADQDVTVTAHTWDTSKGAATALGTADALDRRTAKPGQKMRLRLVNSDDNTRVFTLTGTPYKVVSIDGMDINEPGELTGRRLVLAGAGRMDLEFTMPDTPVRLASEDAKDAGIAFSADGRGSVDPDFGGPEFDKTSYGKPAPAPFDENTEYDRTFDLVFDDWLGFYDGKFALRQTINGRVFPDAPMLMVKEGELIRVRFLNRGQEDHPMHLHGHHVMVLSRDGKPVTGSPIWQDTVLVRPGEEWEIAFKADNPGIWMDHCHNLLHATLGMVMHVAYENVTTPYHVGGKAGNRPD
ncbi:multicopper oxidase domain-containing protein [Streptomyces sp. NPDC052676]|uniref:multicopper oxidase domain-containing protein n=1 Tax=Streptomyces sp. NPDC052676 TaxID=3154953 RepID=UPI003433A4B2